MVPPAQRARSGGTTAIYSKAGARVRRRSSSPPPQGHGGGGKGRSATARGSPPPRLAPPALAIARRITEACAHARIRGTAPLRIGGRARLPARQAEAQVGGGEGIVVRERYGARHGVLQLADVAGPRGIGFQRFGRFRRKRLPPGASSRHVRARKNSARPARDPRADPSEGGGGSVSRLPIVAGSSRNRGPATFPASGRGRGADQRTSAVRVFTPPPARNSPSSEDPEQFRLTASGTSPTRPGKKVLRRRARTGRASIGPPR